MSLKEKLQEVGQKIWEDESVRNKFLDETGEFDADKSMQVVKEMVRTVYDMSKDIKNGSYYLESKWKWFLMIACTAYAVSPLDFIPDDIPGVGWKDDATVIGLAIHFTGDELNKYREWKYGEDVDSIKEEDCGDVIGTATYREIIDDDDEDTTEDKGKNSSFDSAIDRLLNL